MVHEEKLIAYVTSDFVAGHGHKDHNLKVTEEVLKDLHVAVEDYGDG